jgi:hypothetical protein
MLFPGEWFEFIPEGMLLEDIEGVQESFSRASEDNDIRCGYLAYGVPGIDGKVAC